MKKVTANFSGSNIYLILNNEEYEAWEIMSHKEKTELLLEEGEINVELADDSDFEVEEVGDNVSDNQNKNYSFEDEEYVNVELEKFKIYEQVNKCETFEQLAEVIKSITNSNGYIQGRSEMLDGEYMYKACLNYVDMPANSLTREYGIRQQAMYIKYHKIAESMEEDLQKQADETMERFRDSIKWMFENALQSSEENSEEDESAD